MESLSPETMKKIARWIAIAVSVAFVIWFLFFRKETPKILPRLTMSGEKTLSPSTTSNYTMYEYLEGTDAGTTEYDVTFRINITLEDGFKQNNIDKLELVALNPAGTTELTTKEIDINEGQMSYSETIVVNNITPDTNVKFKIFALQRQEGGGHKRFDGDPVTPETDPLDSTAVIFTMGSVSPPATSGESKAVMRSGSVASPGPGVETTRTFTASDLGLDADGSVAKLQGAGWDVYSIDKGSISWNTPTGFYYIDGDTQAMLYYQLPTNTKSIAVEAKSYSRGGDTGKLVVLKRSNKPELIPEAIHNVPSSVWSTLEESAIVVDKSTYGTADYQTKKLTIPAEHQSEELDLYIIEHVAGGRLAVNKVDIVYVAPTGSASYVYEFRTSTLIEGKTITIREIDLIYKDGTDTKKSTDNYTVSEVGAGAKILPDKDNKKPLDDNIDASGNWYWWAPTDISSSSPGFTLFKITTTKKVSTVEIKYHDAKTDYQPVEIFYKGNSIGLVPNPAYPERTKTITLDEH